jgi:hypothetical protein
VKVSERQHDAKDERLTPPGHFVSDVHEADCLRFLEQVKELARRRYEAGLGRVR